MWYNVSDLKEEEHLKWMFFGEMFFREMLFELWFHIGKNAERKEVLELSTAKGDGVHRESEWGLRSENEIRTS